MVITFTGRTSYTGPRPINPNRDFPQLLRLLKAVFADELESGGSQAFDQIAENEAPAVLWRFDPFLSRLKPGFVWEEDGRIVGNVTLLGTRSRSRYVVANVAVDDAYRRRGIARVLLDEAQKEVLRRGGTEIRLQVAIDNHPAKDLYYSLGYTALGSITTWLLQGSRHYQPYLDGPPVEHDFDIRELPSGRWREAFELDRASLPADLHWPDPLAEDTYRRGLVRRISQTLQGKHYETWSVSDERGRLAGLGRIEGEWGRAHQLHVRVRPDHKGRYELALLQKLLRRLQYLPRRRAYLLHDTQDSMMNELLNQARFRPQRKLTQMRLKLD